MGESSRSPGPDTRPRPRYQAPTQTPEMFVLGLLACSCLALSQGLIPFNSLGRGGLEQPVYPAGRGLYDELLDQHNQEKRARKSLVESLQGLFHKRAPAPLMRFSMMQYLRDLENQKYGAVDPSMAFGLRPGSQGRPCLQCGRLNT